MWIGILVCVSTAEEIPAIPELHTGRNIYNDVALALGRRRKAKTIAGRGRSERPWDTMPPMWDSASGDSIVSRMW